MQFTPHRLERGCLLVAWLACGVLAVVLALRISFPWDVFYWCESPFMTNMMKLDRGQSLYTDPHDTNSYVYSPGLDYLCYTTLAPFGKHLDIRYCRLVVVMLGLLSVGILVVLSRRICEAVSGQPLSRGRLLLLIALLILLVFKSVTAESPHPDSLHLLHLAVTALVAGVALRHQSFALAVCAVAVGSLGLWAKQTACLGAFGVALGLVFVGGWGRARSALLVAVAGVLTLLQVWLLFRFEYGRFYLLDVLSSQPIEWHKAIDSIQTPIAQHVLLLLLLPFAGLYLSREQRWRSPLLILWVILGLCETGPALLSYCKVNGAWNNLSVIDVWLFVLVIPFLLQPRGVRESVDSDEAVLGRWFSPVMLSMLLVVVLPTRLPPIPAHYRYCRKLEGQIHTDVNSGKRILLPCGTMVLIHSDVQEVPLDRAHSFTELNLSDKATRTGTLDRIEKEYYDRIYLNCDWYGKEIPLALERHYRKVSTIAPATGQFGYWFGQQKFMCPVVVYERRQPASMQEEMR